MDVQSVVQQFLGSGAAQDAVKALQSQQGMSEEQAKGAVGATASGAAQAITDGGGIGALLGGLTGGGGGGLGGIASALGGLAGGGAPAGGGGGIALPPQMIENIAGFVSSKTGLSKDMAKGAVNVVAPKLIDFVRKSVGGGGGSGGGGLLGGLLG